MRSTVSASSMKDVFDRNSSLWSYTVRFSPSLQFQFFINLFSYRYFVIFTMSTKGQTARWSCSYFKLVTLCSLVMMDMIAFWYRDLLTTRYG